MCEENIRQECRMKNLDATRTYIIEEINRNELMSKKHKKVYTTLNYIEHFLILASTITGCVSISAFASLVCISTARWPLYLDIPGIYFTLGKHLESSIF